MAYEKGQPSIQPGSQQLPQGGASQANALASDPLADPMTNPPVIMAPREEDPITDDDLGNDDDLSILAAPPDPGWTPNPMRPMGRVPKYVVRNLPQMMIASRDPEAPRSLKAMYKAIAAAVEREG